MEKAMDGMLVVLTGCLVVLIVVLLYTAATGVC